MDSFALEPTLYTVKAVLILDNDGERLYAKTLQYYDYLCSLRPLTISTHWYALSHTMLHLSPQLMLMSVLNCLFDSLSQMLRKNVERRALLENMEGLFLAVDEIVDGGVILESDPQQVVYRVALRGDDVPLTEQTVTQVLQSAKEQIKWSLLR
ncbi:coatomer subunit zeta-1-like isoform X2 [Alosa alosa]|uniref:coatomer subunit zeta-1-like isoform X2 n=1 Tax=Alosa alosa TaxID=278164 RepID=UPI0020152E1B|nr:coatomer subunit zeta-1-like isoform X2 [Alosa alosa]